MNTTTKIAISCFVLFAATTAFACDYPVRPSIPDGASASKDDMLAASAAVKTYLGGVDDYLTCLETDEKAAVAALEDADPENLKRRDEMLGKKFDAANDEKALVGEEFNQQVRAYNSARKAAN